MVGGPDRDGVIHTDRSVLIEFPYLSSLTRTSWHGGPDSTKTFCSYDEDFFYGNFMYQCDIPVRGDNATFTFSRPDNTLMVCAVAYQFASLALNTGSNSAVDGPSLVLKET